MEKSLRLWHALQVKAQPVEDWVTEAEAILRQEGENTDELVAKHQAFFERKERKIFREFQLAGKDLCNILEEEDKAQVEQSVVTLENKWRV